MPVQPGRNYQVPNNLLCPVCKEAPETRIFQCIDGHVLCSNCHYIYAVCPSCELPLDKENPIRCLHFEQMLDNLKFPCSFQSNGCSQSLTRTLLPNHESVCCFDFKKFGKLLNICKLLGYSKCEFQLNNGSTKEALEHFCTHHKFNLVKGKDSFEMEYTGFKKLDFKNKTLWTPTIVELETCVVLILPILNNEGIRWFTINLPYTPDKKSLIEVHYSCENVSTKFYFVEIPSTLEKSCREIANFDGFSLPVTFLQQFIKRDHLKITCNVKENQPAEIRGTFRKVVCKPKNLINTDDSHDPDTETLFTNIFKNLFGWNLWKICGFILLVVCTHGFLISNGNDHISKEPAIVQSSNETTGITKEDAILSPFDNWKEMNIQTHEEEVMFLKQVEEYFPTNRNSTLSFLQTLFEEENPKGISLENMKYIKLRSIAMAVKFGTMETLDYVISRKLHLHPNLRHHWIYWTLADPDKKIGVEKAKALVNSGVLTNFEGKNGENPLHVAMISQNEEILEYFLRDVGMDVDAPDASGKTPLHHAVLLEDEDLAVKYSTLLLKHGASPITEDKSGWCPLYLASNYKRDRVRVYELFSELDKIYP